MVNEHLNPSLIARIIDHGHDAVAPEQLRHLAGCRRCLVAFQDVTMILGLESVESATPAAETIPIPRTDATPPWWRRPAWAFGSATLAAISLAVVLLVTISGPRTFDIPESVHALLDEQSTTGFVVARSATRPFLEVATLRSGVQYQIPLDAIADDPEHGERTLLAMLASGRVDEARALLESQPLSIRSEPWARHIEALTAYRSSRLDEAEVILRDLLDHDGDDGVACFNLALLLSETDRGAEAQNLLDRVHADDGSILEKRVLSLRGALD